MVGSRKYISKSKVKVKWIEKVPSVFENIEMQSAFLSGSVEMNYWKDYMKGNSYNRELSTLRQSKAFFFKKKKKGNHRALVTQFAQWM